MSDDLTLWDIERTLADLMIAREDAQTDEERAACDESIAVYVKAEIAKVDGLRAYLKHCEMMQHHAGSEAALQAAREKAWAQRRERLKDRIVEVLDAIGRKRVEGRTGILRIQGNGGVKPLVVQVPGMVPDEMMAATVRLRLSQAKALFEDIGRCNWPDEDELKARFWEAITSATPNEFLIRRALEAGEAVPGCFLDDRGRHLRCE